MRKIINIAHGERIKSQKAIRELSATLDKAAFYKNILAMNWNVFEVENTNVVKEISFDSFPEANQSKLIVKIDTKSELGVNLHTGEIVRFNSKLDAISFEDILNVEDKKYLAKFNHFLDIIARDDIQVIAEYISGLFSEGKIEIAPMQEKLRANEQRSLVLDHIDGKHLLVVMEVDHKENPLIVLDLTDMLIYEMMPDETFIEMCSVHKCVNIDYYAILNVYVDVCLSLVLKKGSDENGGKENKDN